MRVDVSKETTFCEWRISQGHDTPPVVFNEKMVRPTRSQISFIRDIESEPFHHLSKVNVFRMLSIVNHWFKCRPPVIF